jgi:tetratricopeptide (TPR) repeat protein
MVCALASLCAEGARTEHASPLARGIALLAKGQHQAALEAASDACHTEPHRPEPHYLYGQAWMALAEHARAERAFAEAVRLSPEWADAWVNYGVARYQLGAVEDAKAAMYQALAHAPDHSAAAANLAVFLRLTGGGEAAVEMLRSRLVRDPADAGAQLNLAADLLQEERAGEALALLDAVSPPVEVMAARHWHLQRSLALVQLGLSAEARTALTAFDALGPVPAALAPLRLWRSVLLAQAEQDAISADAAADDMAIALEAMGPESVPEHRIMGHYDLAKFRSGRGEHARAFAHWREAHRLLAPSQPFSRATHAAFIDGNRRAFPAARFALGPRAGNRDPAPVFIVGMPRSGTTLCEQILAAHRDVHGAGERPALGRLFAALGGGVEDPEAPARIAALDAPALDKAANVYLAELHALAPAKARIVDKMPANALHLGLVGLMLPGAKVVYCRRDPRDIGLSIFTFRFHGSHGYAHDLGDLGWTIRQRDRLMDHWRGALPNGVHTVDLADWIEDFDSTLHRLLAYLDLPPDPACARFHERESRVRTVSRSQVREPVNARGLGRWRTYEAELAPLIAALDAA